MLPPESSPELPPLSSPLPPLEPPESSPPPPPPLLPLGHEPLAGAKHTRVLLSQQHGLDPLQPLLQSASVLHEVAAAFMSLPLELVGAGARLVEASALTLLVAFSKGLEFVFDDPHAAMTARAPTYVEI
jgi:hypothetical protein